MTEREGPPEPTWGERIMTLAPDVAESIRKHADECVADKRERDRAVYDATESKVAAQLASLGYIVFALEQHGLLMLERIDRVDEDEHTPVRSAIALVHSAATITLQEIRLLVAHGYWVGGAARWRALHELAVTARLIVEGGAGIAQRYLDHGFVVQTRRLATYFDRHGVGPIAKPELAERIRQASDLESRHKRPNERARFRDAYGWATPLLATGSDGIHPRPTFDLLSNSHSTRNDDCWSCRLMGWFTTIRQECAVRCSWTRVTPSDQSRTLL